MIRYFSVFLFLLCLIDAKPLIVTQSSSATLVTTACTYFEDKTQALSLEQLKTVSFTPITAQTFFSTQKRHFWFKCDVLNQTDTSDWVLHNRFNWINSLILFDGNKTAQTGAAIPISKRAFKVRENAFRLTIPPHQRKTFYLLSDTLPHFLDLTLQDHEHFDANSTLSLLIKALFMGIILAMLFYNAILALSLKSVTYGLYVGYIFSFLLFVASDNGILFFYFHPEWPEINSLDSFFFAGIGIFFTILFAIRFLNLKRILPRFSRFLLLYALIVLAGNLIYIFNPSPTTNMIANNIIMIVPFLLVYAGVVSRRSGFKPATLYLIGYATFMLSGLALALHNNHAINIPFIATWGVSFGVAFESILFSLAIYQKLRLDQMEKLRLEKLAQEKDQMLHIQSRMASMGEMMGHVTHQWKQPLSVIAVKVSELELQYQMQTLDQKAFHESLSTIKEQITLMNKTSKDFLNFYKPSHEARPFNLCQTVEDSIRFTQASFKNEAIEVSVLCPDLTLICMGMENELHQVIINILHNAKDALVQNHIKSKIVTIRVEKTHGSAMVTISDNAQGIPEHLIDKIFNPFFTTKAQNGTGLGLSMSKQIIQNMHGKIRVQNTSEGAQFIIEIPLAESDA